MVYFTSDTHFGHKNIIQYSNRPFRDVEHMNAQLIERWNSRVGPEDTVFHLGDFAMGKSSDIAPTRKALNGKIILIKGNHDRNTNAMLKYGFDEVHNSLHFFTKVNGEYSIIYLSHIPHMRFRDELGNTNEATKHIHFCGHVHKAWDRKGDIYNVGVDVRDYYPRTVEEILGL